MICPNCNQDVGEAEFGGYFDPWNGDIGNPKPCPKCDALVELNAEQQCDTWEDEATWVYWLEKTSL